MMPSSGILGYCTHIVCIQLSHTHRKRIIVPNSINLCHYYYYINNNNNYNTGHFLKLPTKSLLFSFRKSCGSLLSPLFFYPSQVLFLYFFFLFQKSFQVFHQTMTSCPCCMFLHQHLASKIFWSQLLPL